MPPALLGTGGSGHALGSLLYDIALVALGGMLGAVARYLVSKLVPGTEIPWGTLIVNVAGSFILSFIAYSTLLAGVFSRGERLLLATGFCGSLTTFSTFAYETFELYTEVSPLYALANAALNLGLGFLAIWAGRALAYTLYR